MEKKENDIITELFCKYHDPLFFYCQRKGVSDHDANEFVDETFLRLINNIDKIKSRNPKEQRAWLYSTADNVIKEHIYKNRHMSTKDFDSLENIFPANDNYDKIINEATYSEVIKRIYSSLNDSDLEFLEDYINDRITYSEIMEAKNTNYNTVKSQIRRRIIQIREITKSILNEYEIEISNITDTKNRNIKK